MDCTGNRMGKKSQKVEATTECSCFYTHTLFDWIELRSLRWRTCEFSYFANHHAQKLKQRLFALALNTLIRVWQLSFGHKVLMDTSRQWTRVILHYVEHYVKTTDVSKWYTNQTMKRGAAFSVTIQCLCLYHPPNSCSHCAFTYRLHRKNGFRHQGLKYAVI